MGSLLLLLMAPKLLPLPLGPAQLLITWIMLNNPSLKALIINDIVISGLYCRYCDVGLLDKVRYIALFNIIRAGFPGFFWLASSDKGISLHFFLVSNVFNEKSFANDLNAQFRLLRLEKALGGIYEDPG